MDAPYVPPTPDDTPVEPVEAIEVETEPIEEAEETQEGACPVECARPRLVVKRAGAETDICFEFALPAVIGRFDPSVGPVDVDLGGIEEGVYVSRKHAKISCEGGVCALTDLGSSNGSFVLRDGDFAKIETAEITDGDEIAFGNARFVFRCR